MKNSNPWIIPVVYFVIACLQVTPGVDLNAQHTDKPSLLIPFIHSNGLYGYKNSAGVVMIKTRFIWADTILSERGLIRTDEGAFALINTAGQIVKKLPFDIVCPFSENLAVVKKGNRYGYINRSGTLVIPLQYFKAWHFSGGMAVAETGDQAKGDAPAEVIIDCKGNVLYSFSRYKRSPVMFREFFSEGLIPFHEDGGIGFMNSSFTDVIRPGFGYVELFREGFALCLKGNDFFIFNRRGEILDVTPAIKRAEPFAEGLAAVENAERLYGFIDTSGTLRIPFQYVFASRFSEGLAAVKMNTRWGFINQKGELCVPFEYDFASNFRDSIAMVQKGNKWMFINRQGKLLSDLYDGSNDFHGGLANVKKDGKWGFINRQGQVVIPFEYDEVKDYFDAKSGEPGGIIRVVKDESAYFINKKNQKVTGVSADIY